ncbi:glycosyltransferase (plasmid) [Cetobacterium somerae]|uniref:glycosyltransferase n=1 Tax=Cetobacterium somerae TaxID=188913 RepID=UPI003D768777
MYLRDLSVKGHHQIYQKSLSKIKCTILQNDELELNFKKDGIKYFFKISNYLKKIQTEDVHYLTLDFLYKYPLIKKLNKNRVVIGTLHKEPNNYLKKILLKNFSKKISKIIVHSEFTKVELNKIGILNVEVIEYPSFYDYSKLKKEDLKKYEKLEEKIVISCLGGTRFDKGLDILLEAFEYMDKNIKNKIVLNIVGKEESFQRDYIQKISKKNNINLRERYGFVTDEDFLKNVLLTDIMVMPYRKIFGGNSGPMTEAIVNKIPSLVPKEMNIGLLTEKYDLGETFEAENPQNLAKVLSEMIEEKKEYFKTEYDKKLTLDNFLKKHEELYRNENSLCSNR